MHCLYSLQAFIICFKVIVPCEIRTFFISMIILICSHAEELMKYLKKHYVEKLNDAKEDLGEELDCFGKPLTW